MSQKAKIFTLFLVTLLANLGVLSAAKKRDELTSDKAEFTGIARPVLWREPTDMAARDLVYGSGGKEHAPAPPFTFLEEDMNGSQPKFDVRDANGTKWGVKLGPEAKPETAASRLVWAAGYFTTEDYFLHEIQVRNMPRHLKRKAGDKFIQPDGTVLDVRLKRHPKDGRKIANWEWRNNPFTGTRELDGLRVVMAVINNWDLKDKNNAIYRVKRIPQGEGPGLIYLISDLGASFGTARLIEDRKKAKGDLNEYLHSKFIRKVEGNSVDFEDPHRPSMIILGAPHEYFSRVNLEWIGKDIPLENVRWMGQILGQLSPEQIRDAFSAAGFSPEEVAGFASEVDSRIGQLKHL